MSRSPWPTDKSVWPTRKERRKQKYYHGVCEKNRIFLFKWRFRVFLLSGVANNWNQRKTNHKPEVSASNRSHNATGSGFVRIRVLTARGTVAFGLMNCIHSFPASISRSMYIDVDIDLVYVKLSNFKTNKTACRTCPNARRIVASG